MDNDNMEKDEGKSLVPFNPNTVSLREHLELQNKYTESLVLSEREGRKFEIEKEKDLRQLTEKFVEKERQLYSNEIDSRLEKMNEIRSQLQSQKEDFVTKSDIKTFEVKIDNLEKSREELKRVLEDKINTVLTSLATKIDGNTAIIRAVEKAESSKEGNRRVTERITQIIIAIVTALLVIAITNYLNK